MMRPMWRKRLARSGATNFVNDRRILGASISNKMTNVKTNTSDKTAEIAPLPSASAGLPKPVASEVR